MGLCGELAEETGRREMVEGCLERLCRLCWVEALEAVDSHTLLIAARAEVDYLKRRLSHLNLMNMKLGQARSFSQVSLCRQEPRTRPESRQDIRFSMIFNAFQ